MFSAENISIPDIHHTLHTMTFTVKTSENKFQMLDGLDIYINTKFSGSQKVVYRLEPL